MGRQNIAVLITTLATTSLAVAAEPSETTPKSDSDQLQEIVITGTSIPTAPDEVAVPVEVLNSEQLEASGLDYTIVRPGGLTDEPPRGLVTLGNGLDRGEIPRADVAATLAAALLTSTTVGKTFELVSGETPIEAALAQL